MRIWIPEFVKNWLVKKAAKTPYFDLEGYMLRDWLRIPPGHSRGGDQRDSERTGIGARIHRILRSDDDRAPHDHPWWSISIVLWNGYWEHLYTKRGIKKKWRGPGAIVFRSANTKHRLELHNEWPATTLFIMGPWKHDWGFWVNGFWVYWKDFCGVKHSDTDLRLDGRPRWKPDQLE